MNYDFSSFDTALEKSIQAFTTDLAGIRSGQANPALLDGVKVEVYGSMMPLKQVASITTEDARTLRVSPWDKSVVKAVEGALRDADLGVSIGSDEQGVRVSFPELTSDRRAQLVKLTRQKLEEARGRVRRNREEAWQDIQAKEKAKEMGEDDKFRAKETMEEKVKEANSTLEDLAKRKEAELAL
jgi:ribosome recycling factor